MNVIDKAIEFISPHTALKRSRSRAVLKIINSGYGNYGASTNKDSTIGWLYGGGSAKEDITHNLPRLRQRSRDLYMGGAPIATGALKGYRTNVVGSGLKLKSQVDYTVLGLSESEARELESRIEREFALWAETVDCDIERIDNFYELQQLVFLNWIMSGDVIVLMPITERVNSPYDLRIRIIEADRVSTPDIGTNDRIEGGVERNTDGEVVAYHVSNEHPLSADTTIPKWVRVEAFGKKTGRRNVIHLMNRERIGQVRGVPLLAPVIEPLKQLGRYGEAELTAAVVNGLFAVFIEKNGPKDGLAIGSVLPTEQQVDAGNPNTIELAPGIVLDLEEGEKANPVSPNRPNANFNGFVTAVSREIGTAIEMPYEVLLKHFTSSYSASRGALLEFWKSVRMFRSWLANDFCQPIFEEWLSEAVAKGRIHAPGFFANPIIRKAYCGVEWNGPAQGLLDPKKEAEAAEMRITSGLSSREREAMEMNGSDFYRNMQQLRQEESLMQEVFGSGRTANKPINSDGDEPGGSDEEDDSDDKQILELQSGEQ